MTVKCILSYAIMLLKCSCGPLSIAKLPMNARLPHVKLSANFWGRTVMSGMPTKNPNAKNIADRRRQMTKI